jgi:MFS family permease
MSFAVAGLLGFAFAADGFWSALAWRFVAGIGLAGTYMPGLRALTDRLPERGQARAVAFYTSSFSIGSAGSFAIAGAALELVDWRGAFVVSAIGPALGALLIWLVLRPAPPDRTHRADTHVFDFRPVLANRQVMGYVLPSVRRNAVRGIV